ncbi:MAG: type II CAAX endopeptidase family protein [Syntrophomonadaceae bacterium]|nr:type II CAAX endopeptidase family protein [Syntrophomonadaceae bacterium]MDD3023167.1 type II CAAX endopeptidase family protein [Syntrophomonadaceae bacterium]
MNRDTADLRWGLVEIIMVFAGIIGVGMIFGLYADRIMMVLTQLGLPVTDFSFFILSFLIQFICTVLLVLLFTVWLKGASLKELGLKKANRQDLLKYGLLGGILLMSLVLLLGLIVSYLQPEVAPQVFEEMLRSAGGTAGFAIIFFIGAVMAPFAEELYYRGMIYPVFRNYLGPFGGAVVAGLLFGAAHWDLWRTLPLAVGGALLCYIYEKTGSIWVSILAHGVWNGIMSMVVYFSIFK